MAHLRCTVNILKLVRITTNLSDLGNVGAAIFDCVTKSCDFFDLPINSNFIFSNCLSQIQIQYLSILATCSIVVAAFVVVVVCRFHQCLENFASVNECSFLNIKLHPIFKECLFQIIPHSGPFAFTSTYSCTLPPRRHSSEIH